MWSGKWCHAANAQSRIGQRKPPGYLLGHPLSDLPHLVCLSDGCTGEGKDFDSLRVEGLRTLHWWVEWGMPPRGSYHMPHINERYDFAGLLKLSED